MAKLFSVIIPVYNAARFLPASLNSLSRQTCTDFEVILIDDGSSDDSYDLCARHAKADSRFRVQRQDNSGSASARNAGLDSAVGDYIVFLDADDWLALDALAILASPINGHRPDAVSYDLAFEPLSGASRNETNSLRGGYFDEAQIESEVFPRLIAGAALQRDWPYRMVTKAFRRRHLDDTGVRFDESLAAAQDFAFSVSAMYRASSFIYQKGAIKYHYRQNPASRTNRALSDSWENYAKLTRSLRRSVCGDERFATQLELADLHGQLSALTLHYKGATIAQSSDLYREMVIHAPKVANHPGHEALDRNNLNLRKRAVIALLRHGHLAGLHALLLGYHSRAFRGLGGASTR